MSFIYTPVWQAIGVILFAAVIFTVAYCFHDAQTELEDEGR